MTPRSLGALSRLDQGRTWSQAHCTLLPQRVHRQRVANQRLGAAALRPFSGPGQVKPATNQRAPLVTAKFIPSAAHLMGSLPMGKTLA